MPKITEEKVPKPKASNKIPHALRGFKDILPEDQLYWAYLRRVAADFAGSYGFGQIDLPVLEDSSLFVRSIGKDTDIVDKEMFTFTDKNEGSVTLRPEFTAAVARAYIGHGMFNNPQPVKLFQLGPVFRRERPQSGRLRQFNQIGFEVIGDSSPVIDAQLISIAHSFFQKIGLSGARIQVNSIGTPKVRKIYEQELVTYFRSKRKLLSEEAKQKLKKNPLRLLDSKDELLEALRADAPQIIDWLDDESKAHFMKVIEYLDGLDIPYILNPYLVRGLDYYTHTVFEVWSGDESTGAQSALGGGGRYDGLVELLGGRPTPAAGFAIGVERIISELKKLEVKIPATAGPKVFLAQIGDQAKIKAMQLFDKLRAEKIKVAESFTKDSLKNQLDLANRVGARYVLIIGQKEVVDGTILIRDMESGVQEVVDLNKTISEIKKKLANN